MLSVLLLGHPVIEVERADTARLSERLVLMES